MNNEVKAINKRCPKCKQLLPVVFFNKSTKNDDGLQRWCKSCKKENSRKNYVLHKKRKHNNELTLLSYYHRKHGLEYNFLESKKKNDYRKYISYKCLNCGTEIKSSIKDAIVNKFICDDCNKIDNKKLLSSSKINPSKKHEEIFTAVWTYPKHLQQECDCKNNCSENCEKNEYKMPESLLQQKVEELNKDLMNDEIIKKIKTLHKNIHHSQSPVLLIIEVPQKQQLKELKKGFWNWIKNLFHK